MSNTGTNSIQIKSSDKDAAANKKNASEYCWGFCPGSSGNPAQKFVNPFLSVLRIWIG